MKNIAVMRMLLTTGVALLSLSSCSETGKEKVDKLSEMEFRTDDQTTVYTDNIQGESIEEPETLICLPGKLNVHAEPGSGAKTIATIYRGDIFTALDNEYPDTELDYSYWLLIEAADGTQGWIPEMFVIDIEVYKQLGDVDGAARTGDSAKTEAAIKAFNKEVEIYEDLPIVNFYLRSPDGGKFAISSGPGGFIVTVGYGVSSRAPLGGLGRTGSWQYGSKYWSIRTGDCAAGGFNVYETESMKPVLETYIWLHNYEFLKGSEVLVWPTTLAERKIEYPLVNGPSTKPDYSSNVADIEYFTYDLLPCLMVYEFASGDSYMAAAPDLTTISNSEVGSGYVVTMKPTERFTSNPLFKPVSETEVYKEWVGIPVNGCLSEE